MSVTRRVQLAVVWFLLHTPVVSTHSYAPTAPTHLFSDDTEIFTASGLDLNHIRLYFYSVSPGLCDEQIPGSVAQGMHSIMRNIHHGFVTVRAVTVFRVRRAR